MESFTFQIQDPMGLTIKKAGILVKEAVNCDSRVTIRKGDKSGDAKLIFNVLCLSIKCNDEIELFIEGEHEKEEAKYLHDCVQSLIKE